MLGPSLRMKKNGGYPPPPPLFFFRDVAYRADYGPKIA